VHGLVMCLGVCRIHEEFGGLRDQESWPDHGFTMREGLCCEMMRWLFDW